MEIGVLDILEECPSSLCEAVGVVFDSLPHTDVEYLVANSHRFCVGCEDVEGLDCLGKVFCNNTNEGEYYVVNIWPCTLGEFSWKDVLYVVAHEVGHLFHLLHGTFVDGEVDEGLADEFALGHGFRPDKLELTSRTSVACF